MLVISNIAEWYQLVDTPGLLDRPMEERNQIEMQAIAALEHVGDLCLFLMDPSETGGTSMEEQTNLLNEVADVATNPFDCNRWQRSLRKVSIQMNGQKSVN